MPGQLTAARVILFVQGGLGVIATLLVLLMTIIAAGLSALFTSEFSEDMKLLGVGVTLFMVVVLVISALITGVTFFLAARFTRRRHGSRIGILVLEGIFGALTTVSAIGRLASGETSGVLSLLFAALCWTVFAILLTEPAKRYFNAV